MNLTPAIKIIIADDHPLIRSGFKTILQQYYPAEIHFIAEARNGLELVEAVGKHTPDLVLTDIQMPVMDGINASRVIKQKHPKVNIIAFSMFDDTSNITSMLRAGANGYLSKMTEKEEILDAIRIVSSGKPYYCSTISSILYGQPSVNTNNRRKEKQLVFTTQEISVMRFICQQLSTKEIAGKLNVAVRTVENQRYHIQEKIGAKNMVGVALYAVMNNLVKFSELS